MVWVYITSENRIGVSQQSTEQYWRTTAREPNSQYAIPRRYQLQPEHVAANLIQTDLKIAGGGRLR